MCMIEKQLRYIKLHFPLALARGSSGSGDEFLSFILEFTGSCAHTWPRKEVSILLFLVSLPSTDTIILVLYATVISAVSKNVVECSSILSFMSPTQPILSPKPQ